MLAFRRLNFAKGSGELLRLCRFSSESQSTPRWKPPSEILYDDAPRHKKYTSRARKALRATFENDGGLKHLFTLTYGFEVCNIRMSLNKRTLFVQWDCFPERKHETIHALHENMIKIRSAFGKYFGARVLPRLEFRHDSFSASQLELESAFAELEEKEDTTQIRTALGTQPHKV